MVVVVPPELARRIDRQYQRAVRECMLANDGAVPARLATVEAYAVDMLRGLVVETILEEAKELICEPYITRLPSGL